MKRDRRCVGFCWFVLVFTGLCFYRRWNISNLCIQVLKWRWLKREDSHIKTGRLLQGLNEAASLVLDKLNVALGLPARLAHSPAPALGRRLFGFDASLHVTLDSGIENGHGDTLSLPAGLADTPAPTLVLLNLLSSLGLPARLADAPAPALLLLLEIALAGRSVVAEEGGRVFRSLGDKNGKVLETANGLVGEVVGDAVGCIAASLDTRLDTANRSDGKGKGLVGTLGLPTGLADAPAPGRGVGGSHGCGSEEGDGGEELHFG